MGRSAPSWPSPARTLLQMPLGSEGLLQGHLVVRVLELPVLPLGGPADSHSPNGHSSLGCLSCSRERKDLSAGRTTGGWVEVSIPLNQGLPHTSPEPLR